MPGRCTEQERGGVMRYNGGRRRFGIERRRRGPRWQWWVRARWYGEDRGTQSGERQQGAG
jgi:hypothetical protein